MNLLKDTVLKLIDPDYEMELRPDIENELNESVKPTKKMTAEEVAKDLGLEY